MKSSAKSNNGGANSAQQIVNIHLGKSTDAVTPQADATPQIKGPTSENIPSPQKRQMVPDTQKQRKKLKPDKVASVKTEKPKSEREQQLETFRDAVNAYQSALESVPTTQLPARLADVPDNLLTPSSSSEIADTTTWLTNATRELTNIRQFTNQQGRNFKNMGGGFDARSTFSFVPQDTRFETLKLIEERKANEKKIKELNTQVDKLKKGLKLATSHQPLTTVIPPPGATGAQTVPPPPGATGAQTVPPPPATSTGTVTPPPTPGTSGGDIHGDSGPSLTVEDLQTAAENPLQSILVRIDQDQREHQLTPSTMLEYVLSKVLNAEFNKSIAKVDTGLSDDELLSAYNSAVESGMNDALELITEVSAERSGAVNEDLLENTISMMREEIEKIEEHRSVSVGQVPGMPELQMTPELIRMDIDYIRKSSRAPPGKKMSDFIVEGYKTYLDQFDKDTITPAIEEVGIIKAINDGIKDIQEGVGDFMLQIDGGLYPNLEDANIPGLKTAIQKTAKEFIKKLKARKPANVTQPDPGFKEEEDLGEGAPGETGNPAPAPPEGADPNAEIMNQMTNLKTRLSDYENNLDQAIRQAQESQHEENEAQIITDLQNMMSHHQPLISQAAEVSASTYTNTALQNLAQALRALLTNLEQEHMVATNMINQYNMSQAADGEEPTQDAGEVHNIGGASFFGGD